MFYTRIPAGAEAFLTFTFIFIHPADAFIQSAQEDRPSSTPRDSRVQTGRTNPFIYLFYLSVSDLSGLNRRKTRRRDFLLSRNEPRFTPRRSGPGVGSPRGRARRSVR